MVTYNDVKTKLQNTRQSILREMTIKRLTRSKSIYEQVRDKIKYIQDALVSNVGVGKRMTIDRHLLELYYLNQSNEIGEKKVSFNYNDTIETINGRDLIPFSVFDFDSSLYDNGVKNIALELNKQIVLARTSAVGVEGDWEDAVYAYFKATSITEGLEIERNFETLYGDWAEFIPAMEFNLFGLESNAFYLGLIKGVGWYVEFGTDLNVMLSDSGLGYINTTKDSSSWKATAYRVMLAIMNSRSYDIEIVYKNQIFKCSAGKVVYYIHFMDAHLTQSPIKLFETTV